MSKPSPWWRAPAGADSAGNSAKINVQLKPVGVRKATSDQVIARLRRQTSGVPGANMFLQNSQDVRIGGRQGNAQYQYTLQAPDFDSLAVWGPKVLDRLSTLPEIADVSSDQQNSGLSSNVVIDRDTASRLGLTAQAVDSALYDAFGQRQVSVMYKSINQYHVVLALQQQWWESPDFLNTIYVQTPRGTDVPLSTFTHFTQGITPISLPHQGQFPATTLSFNLAEDVPLSDAVAAINRAEVEMGLPANITGKFAGTARAYQEALANQPILIGTALLAVYIVLGMLYESLIHPLTIISTLPSAGVGALVAMVLFKSNLDIDRHDRNYPADWHREEERDHDDRFRAGGRTERRDEFAGCDLPGLSAAVPAHHDDDHVRAAGRDADGARLGRWERSCGSLWEFPSSAAWWSARC